ncbi:DNA-binding protein [Dysgonomonas sp. 216]|uniref:helix-turn-helix domain-containing protein n=1 Tax=Dysgonomonas sp. 216 TaxID=2302934 RepID=UPI0013D6426C|nr:helix-turn-helix domain-containing protein [Dysgonomonas sp. 216]NDW19903.1 DNA-binding protein [Dysgonomonas sp. 216]
MNINSEDFESWMRKLISRFDKIESILSRNHVIKECLDGDTLLDNQDLCKLLGVTKRTLQRYRDEGKITFYMIHGKTYYKKSEIMDFFKAFKRGK